MRFRFSFLLILLLIFSIPVLSQEVKAEDWYKSHREFCVIATGGLRMRSSPDPGGKILKTVPFGQKVQVARPDQDTAIWFRYPWIHLSDGVSAGWMHARYLNHLCMDTLPQEGVQLMMEERVRPCAPLGYTDKKSFFAVFNQGNGSLLQKIRPGFEMGVPYGLWGPQPFITTSSRKKSLMILAGEGVFQEGPVPMADPVPQSFAHPDCDAFSLSGIRLKDGNLLSLRADRDSTGNRNNTIEISTATGVRQVLIETGFCGFRLFWSGDLDRDGTVDLLLELDDEKSLEYRLYLSSKAKTGEIVSPVAAFSIYTYGC